MQVSRRRDIVRVASSSSGGGHPSRAKYRPRPTGRCVWGQLAEEAIVEAFRRVHTLIFNGLKAPPGAACARGSPAQVQASVEKNYVDMNVGDKPGVFGDRCSGDLIGLAQGGVIPHILLRIH